MQLGNSPQSRGGQDSPCQRCPAVIIRLYTMHLCNSAPLPRVNPVTSARPAFWAHDPAKGQVWQIGTSGSKDKMRSSKSRSRSKANRPRSLGNIVNRVFDSSGPEGKVRGTPQQIIEKYQMLARDAQLSNDRVAAENFSQHAEHYTRMLAEAMREMAAEQESRQQQYQQNGQNGQNGQRDRQGDQRGDRPNDYRGDQRGERAEFRPERGDPAAAEQPWVGGFAAPDEEDTGLVDLPETPRAQPRRDDRSRENRDQPRRFENRRDDRPRDQRPAPERPASDAAPEPQAPAALTPVAPPADLPRFESPAELVAQVEKSVRPTRSRAANRPKPRLPKPRLSKPRRKSRPGRRAHARPRPNPPPMPRQAARPANDAPGPREPGRFSFPPGSAPGRRTAPARSPRPARSGGCRRPPVAPRCPGQAPSGSSAASCGAG